MNLKIFVILLFIACKSSLVAQVGFAYKTGIKYEAVFKKLELPNHNPKKIEKSVLHKPIKSYECKGYEAFFCRMETKLDKKLKTPIRFRLGSYDYVNQLEGKW